MTKVLHIDPGEVITSMVDKLVSIKAKNIFLVIPSNAIFWHNIVNLRLLKREANNLNKNITIVNADRIKRELAERVGFQTINEIPSGALRDEVGGYKVEKSLESMLITQPNSQEPVQPRNEPGFSEGVFNKIKSYKEKPKKVSDIIWRPLKKAKGRPLEEQEKSISADRGGISKDETGEYGDESVEIGVEEEKRGKKVPASETKFTDSGYPIVSPRRIPDEIKKSQPEFKIEQGVEEKDVGDYIKPTREKESLEKSFFEKPSPFDRASDFTEKSVSSAEDEEIQKDDFIKKGDLGDGYREDKYTGKPGHSAWYSLNRYMPKTSGLFLIIFWIVIAVLVGGIFLVVLPQAELNIFRKTEQHPFSIDITVDPESTSVSFDNNVIPGQILKTINKDERKFLSSGEKDTEDKASGSITIYNELDSTPQPMIPSRFQDEESGKIFWSTKSIVVPGAKIKDGSIVPGTIKVDVVASEPGDDFNINCSASDPCSFTIPAWRGTVKFNKLYAKSTSPISGGSVGKVKVVTEEDIKKAEREVLTILKDNARNTFLSQVPQDLNFLEESLREKVISSSAGVEAGDVASEFTFEAELEFSGFVFNDSDVEKLIEYNVEKNLPNDKELLDKDQEIKFSVSYDDEGGIAMLAEGSLTSVWKIDTDKIKNEILKKNESELRKYFGNIYGIESVRVNFWPFWVGKVPNKESKIDIIISE